MSFGLTVEKIFLIGLIAVLVVGPERLPGYAAQFARFIRMIRDFARGAEDRLKGELGDDFDIAELKKLDPRQYDPRRIIRDALTEDARPSAVKPSSVRPAKPSENQTTPFDGEST